jgi:DUF4097 and DUF4098 domain-containing protein YvlB
MNTAQDNNMNSHKLTTNNRSSRLHRLVLAGTMAALAATTVYADDKVVENFDFQPGQTLKLDFSEGGSIRIEGWDELSIEAQYEDEDYGLDQYDINFESTVDGLKVTAGLLEDANSSGLEFYFKVPRELNVQFDTAGGGITLEGLVGDFSGHTGGGNLLVRDVAGNLNLQTGGGRILVEDSEVDGLVETGGGRVLVQNVIGDFNATSGGGEVKFLNFVSASGNSVSPNSRNLDDATSGTVLISNAGGGIKIETAPEGADVSTGGGKIRVRGADRFVAASTGGGDIELELTEGWVDASTGAGDVDINIAQNSSDKGDVKVVSGLGDINLTVPADFSMNLVVELGVTNNVKKSFKVNSDFDVSTETDADWDYSHGTPRKVTRGTANVNGGDHTVYIRTTNGNVNIKKAQ